MPKPTAMAAKTLVLPFAFLPCSTVRYGSSGRRSEAIALKFWMSTERSFMGGHQPTKVHAPRELAMAKCCCSYAPRFGSVSRKRNAVSTRRGFFRCIAMPSQ